MMTLTTLILALVACGGSEPADHGHDHDHPPGTPADHDHDHDHADHAPGAAAPAPAAGHDHAAAHAPGGGHMADMVATREKLRATLGAAYDAPVPGLDAADAAHGKAVYDASCASCHGAGGKGDGAAGAGLAPPPSDLTDAFHARFYSDAARVHIVRNGLEGTAMAAFAGPLSDADILDVYAHVRGLRPEAGAAAPAGEHAHH